MSICSRMSVLLVFGVVSAHRAAGTPIFTSLQPAPTTPYSHITSFLQQKRSDSRADKPDEFPNFDFDQIDKPTTTTTTAPSITKAQVYQGIAGGVIEDIRDRITNVLSQGQNDRLQTQQQQQDVEDNGTVDGTTEFIGLSLDEEDSQGPEIIIETTNLAVNTSAESLPDDEIENINNNNNNFQNNFLVAKFNNKTRAIATLAISSLLRAWTTAQQNLHFPTTSRVVATNNPQEEQLPSGHRNVGNVNPSGTILGAWLPAAAATTTTFRIKQNLRGMPFRNAFYKYSNLVGKGSYNETADNPFATSTTTTTTATANSNESAEIESKLNQDDEFNNDDDDDEDSDGTEDNNDESENGRFLFNEGLGIYILEIIGTIAGLTWGAISQIQNVFGNRQ